MTHLAKVYRRAAERIASGESYLACIAIGDTESSHRAKAEFIFAEFFQPRSIFGHQAWFGYSDIQQNQMARSLALLLMTEMAEEGSL